MAHPRFGRLPKNDCSPHLSAAFLAIWEERFSEAVDEYRRAEKCDLPHPDMVMGVIRFLSGLADRNQGRPELRFATAFISDAFMDRELGASEFKRFLTETESDTRAGIKTLRRTAEARLRRQEKLKSHRNGDR
jgi:hypothetical protein